MVRRTAAAALAAVSVLAVSASSVDASPALRHHRAVALAATAVDSAHVRLAWDAVPGAASYRVTRGSLVVATTGTTSFVDSLLWPSSSYGYHVDALAPDGSTLSTLSATAVTAPLPSGGFPRPFPATSFWNTPIGPQPAIDPQNAAHMAYFDAHLNYPNMPLHAYGVSLAEASTDDPLYSVPCTKYT